MNKTITYDAILVFETDFQKTIVDKIVKLFYAHKNILLLDARNFKISFSGKTYHLNLNGIKNTLFSLRDLFLFPKLNTEELICTAFTGINCRLFPKIINYSILTLIDDGSGTPAILLSGTYPWTFKLRTRYWFANTLFVLSNGKLLNTTKSLIKKAQRYYCIYDFVNNNYSDYTRNLTIKKVDYFSKHDFESDCNNDVGFVSNGAGDNNNLLDDVFLRTGKKPIYYPHPHENTNCINKNKIREIIRPDGILEDYFIRSGTPKMLFGDPSTVFINLRQLGFPANRMVIYYDKSRMNDAYYYIFKNLGMSIIYKNEVK